MPCDSTTLALGRDFLNFWMYGDAAWFPDPGPPGPGAVFLAPPARRVLQLVFWMPALQLAFGHYHIPGPALIAPLFVAWLVLRLRDAERQPPWLGCMLRMILILLV